MITAMPRIAIAVHDLAAAVATFRDRLGMPVIDLSASSVASLGASLAMCVPERGSNIELMAPARPEAPLSQSLQGFLERRGAGPFALMLEAPDPDREAASIGARGLDVLPLMEGASGRDIHPRSTHGVLIRIYPVGSFTGTAASHAGDAGLSGIVRVMIAVRDLAHARAVYCDVLGLPGSTPGHDAERGVDSVLVTPPAGGTIELVAVADAARPFAAALQAFLEQREGLYALVLCARDPEATCGTLASRGLPITQEQVLPRVFEIDPATVFGTRLLVEPRFS
jgi:catechol 2,3-dioxygenase-like lactoylglutathione lyase family enzyme